MVHELRRNWMSTLVVDAFVALYLYNITITII